mgnify:CR=1 FL=1
MATGLNADLGAIAAHALLSAGFVTYLADEQEALRASVLAGWEHALAEAGLLGGGGGGGGRPAFSLTGFLSSEGQLLRWKSQGLPSDSLSSENALVILHAPQPPLIIDPSSQAASWLRTYLTAQELPLECVTPQEPRFANALELGKQYVLASY